MRERIRDSAMRAWLAGWLPALQLLRILALLERGRAWK
jgi:hypothetical protein